MRIKKKFKIIAGILILAVTTNIISQADLKNNIETFFSANNILNSRSNERTELGNLQNIIVENKNKLSKSIEEERLDSCKELLVEISKNIEESQKNVKNELDRAQKIVDSTGYNKAGERLQEVKLAYENILSNKSKIEAVIASNTIDDYKNILNDNSIFEEENKKVNILGDTLPHNNSVANATVVDLKDVEEVSSVQYDVDTNLENSEEYLKETIDTIQTVDIKSKADEIGSNPIKLYEFVRNNINYQPYAGSRKGAIGALKEFSGNDYDTSSLLISLLRSQNIPARYAKGKIELTPDKAMAWTGTNNIESAVRILASAGNPTTSIIDGGEIVAVRVDHVWVEAYCSVGEYRGYGKDLGEKQWIPFDASFKEYKQVEGMNLVEKAEITNENIEELFIFNEKNGDGLGNKNTELFGFDELLNYADYNTNNNVKEADLVGKRAVDISGGIDIVKEELAIYPYSIPNKVVTIENRSSEIDNKMRDYISFDLIDDIGLFGELHYKKSAVELYGKKLTLSWIPASESDSKIISEYGGDMFNVPAYLIEVKPVIRVDGKIEAEGSAIQFGQYQNLNIAINRVGFSTEKIKDTLISGGYYALGLDYGVISPQELQEIEGRVKAAKGKVDELGYYNDNVLGEIVNGTVKNYFAQVDGMNKLLSQSYNVRETRLLSFGISGVNPKVSTVITKPVDVKLSSLYVDIDSDAHVLVSENNEKSKESEYSKQSGILSSALEHSIVQQISGIKGVSTIQVLQEAISKGISIYSIDKSNIDEILPKLNVNEAIKVEIKNAVNSNKEVLIPADNIEIYDWNGSGYVVLDKDTSSAGYMISGGLAGGSTSEDLSLGDWAKIAESFFDGFIEGVKTGIIFSIITIGIMVILPELIPYYLTLMSVICTITLGYDIFTHIKSLYEGEMSTLDWYCYCAEMAGMMIGCILAGTFTSKFLINQVEVKIKNTNEKYGISQKESAKIRENTAVKDYSKVAEQVSKLKELGLNENQICDMLDGVQGNKLSEFYNALKGLKNKSPEGEISQRSIEAIKKAVQEGKSGDDLIKAGELAINPEKLINSGESFEINSLEWITIRDFYSGKVRNIRLENKGVNNLGGNVSYADVSIDGNTYSIKGTSKPKNIEGFAELKGDPNSKIDPQRFFETKFVDGKGNVYDEYIPRKNWNRAVDTEARTLEQVCRELGSYKNDNGEIVWKNTDATGTINIYTENKPCPSCLDVINQFKSIFKNIEIKIYWSK